MTNYLAFTPEPFSIELTYADLVKATKRAGAESVRISLRFEGNDTFEFKGPIRSDDFLVALATSAAIEADKHMDKVLAQVIEELTEAIRLSLESIGTQKLRARPGWAWFDALVKYAPHKAELFGPVFPQAESDGEETKAEELGVRLGRVAQEANEAVPYGSGTEALHLAVGEAVLAELARGKAWQDLEDDTYNRNVPGYVPKTDGKKADEHATLDGIVTPEQWVKRAEEMPLRSNVRATHAGSYVPSTPPGGAEGTHVGFKTLKGAEQYTDTATGPGQDPEDKPDFKPNAMAVYASNTDERVVVHSPDRTTFKYVRGAFNQNGDFITLDRLREVPDGYRLVNWGRDDIEADA